jgi:hypothetical protein
MDDKFVVKDSGKREEFKGGMVRDTADNKTDYSLPLNGPMFERWATHLTKGATKYPDTKPGSPNWMLASGEEEYVRFRKSAVRHFIQWYSGQTDEDHAAAVLFNINGAEYVKDKLAKEIKGDIREVDAKTYAHTKKHFNPWV